MEKYVQGNVYISSVVNWISSKKLPQCNISKWIDNMKIKNLNQISNDVDFPFNKQMIIIR